MAEETNDGAWDGTSTGEGDGRSGRPPYPGNLLPETRSFVGRAAELAWLDRELDPGTGVGRLVSLVGAGGVGKTRLASRAAARVRDAYPDGVWLVELSVLRTAGLVGLAVVEALRLADQSTGPVVDVVAEWARGKRLLLILDSCEHVLADCVALAGTLLPALPGLRILVTSREQLGVPGERVLHVDPLPVADDAVALFAERAAATGFTLDATNRPAVEAVCRHLDGIPLAIELAAVRLAELSLTELHGRLDEHLTSRLDVLGPGGGGLGGEIPGGAPEVPGGAQRIPGDAPEGAGGNPKVAGGTLEIPGGTPEVTGGTQGVADAPPGRPRDGDTGPPEGPPRHHTLRTAIGWSHQLCTPLERLLWARLSVFADGFCVGAAEEVCSGGPLPAGRIPALLDRLVEQSIVRRHRTDPSRYQFLDTVREFGADWLRALGEQRAVRLRHRDYYRRLAREGCAEWNTGRQVAWCERVLTEHADLRAAMDCALIDPGSRPALEMAADIGFLWRHCGYLRDAQHCLDLVLAADPPPGPDRTRALWSRGAVALLQGDLDVAAGWAARCADAAREQGDAVATVAAAYLTGAQLALSGSISEAIDVLSAAPRLPIGEDAFGAAQLQVRVGLSFAHMMDGDHDRARTVAHEAREASVACGESWTCAFADAVIAQADLATGDTRAAVRNARTAVAGHALMHNTVGAALALDVLAAAVVAEGDGPRAARLLGIAAHVWELTGRAQMDSPDLIATRRSHELRVREEIGGSAYEKAYDEGRGMPYEEGLDYAVRGG
ncbi:ATP-binding protein [Streptomyces sp. NPDC127072]|uniref:ATP-binding protein n=1 Tax=Streptomyces sp. NPDC127072 TaxID=3347129 RepID=UPI003665D214